MILHSILHRYVPYRNENQQWPQIVAAIIVALGIFDGLALVTWTSPTLPILMGKESPIGQLSLEEAAYLAVLPFIGSALSCLLVARFMDYAGRKNALILMAMLQITSWILIALAPNFFVLCASRVLAGIADATGLCTMAAYLPELVEPKVRNFCGPLLTFNLFLGQFLINLVGSYCDIPTTACIFLCVPLLQVLLLLGTPESPYFLCMKGRFADAKTSLQKLRWNVNVDYEFGQIELAVKHQTSQATSYADLFFVRANRVALLVCLALRGISQFSGLTAFMVFTQYLFDLAGTNWSGLTSSIAYFGLFLVVSTPLGFVYGYFGRKPLMTISCFGCFLSLATVSIFLYIHEKTHINVLNFNWIPLAGMMLYIIFCSLGMSTIPNLMIGELFSASAKAKAMGIVCLGFAIYAVTVIKMFQILTDMCGMYLPFCIFAISSFLGCLFSYWFLPETKGKSLNQIVEELGGKRELLC